MPVVIKRIANPALAVPPMLNMVVLNPDATPLLLAGTELMIELILGATNMPLPTPSNINGMATSI